MPNLLFEYHEKIADIVDSALLANRSAAGTRVYINLHNPYNSQAINFTASEIYYFQEYDQALHSDFCGILDESADRSKYHFLAIPVASIILPDTEYGQHYTVEYWIEAASGIQDRDIDDILLTERLYWRDNRRAGAFLDLSQEESIGLQVWKQIETDLLALAADTAGRILLSIRDQTDLLPAQPASARFESFCSLSYDTAIQRIGFAAWLEKDGVLQVNAKSANVIIYDSSGTAIASASSATIDASGHFPMEALSIALSPDEAYFLDVTIVDISDVSHKTGGSAVGWD